MALPIAPTPVLTGKSAIRLERYMRESKYKREKIANRHIDYEKIDRIVEELRKERKAKSE